ncbi:MAG: hypothetical protein IH951_03680 [Bacteroidetes bacterium]|nr:hypothetical protein [Bacteroidota bacterium]
MTRLIGYGTMLVFVMSGVSACTSAKNVASDQAEEERQTTDIAWLTKSLQDEGVFITERGFPNLSIAAISSSRLYLNDREVLDVYGFEKIGDAMSNAYTLANKNPGRDVFLKESLVVVRYSNRDTGLSQTLFELLGVAL